MTMPISSIKGISTVSGDEAPGPKDNAASLGQDDFLNLLITQLQNQDPLSPMESADFTAQLAQFSSLEQLFDVNDRLEQMQAQFTSQGSGDILGYVGKVVTAGDNQMLVDGIGVTSGGYSIDDAADVIITVFDSNGLEVKRIQAEHQEPGTYAFEWDGRDNGGARVSDGSYSYEVSATNDRGDSISARTQVTGEVIGITYEYAVPHLMIGERFVPAASVIEVRIPESVI